MTIIIKKRNLKKFYITKKLTEMLTKTVKLTIKHFNLTNNIEVYINFVELKHIKYLNSKFRKTNKITDVLSFQINDFETPGTFDDISDIIMMNTVMLGDIIISPDIAKKQALEYGHSLERELIFLTIHSLLHLLGFDHLNITDEEKMFPAQYTILNELLKIYSI